MGGARPSKHPAMHKIILYYRNYLTFYIIFKCPIGHSFGENMFIFISTYIGSAHTQYFFYMVLIYTEIPNNVIDGRECFVLFGKSITPLLSVFQMPILNQSAYAALAGTVILGMDGCKHLMITLELLLKLCIILHVQIYSCMHQFPLISPFIIGT